MKSYKSGKIIEEVAKNHGIKYTSLYHKSEQALKLREHHRTIQEILGDLEDIREEYHGDMYLDTIVDNLEKVNHDIAKLANKLGGKL
jgi:hypothetical protein